MFALEVHSHCAFNFVYGMLVFQKSYLNHVLIMLLPYDPYDYFTQYYGDCEENVFFSFLVTVFFSVNIFQQV